MTSAPQELAQSIAISQIIEGLPVSDGAGVKLTRYIGTPTLEMVDPFLLLDVFESNKPGDYIAGFPNHPHRGFETVTYLLDGRMRHKDNLGNEGVIEPGGVQWMTAGRGIIHSEFPEQEDGLLFGFQLWVNLPSSAKWVSPTYQEYSAQQIPELHLDDGVHVKVIAGNTLNGVQGPVQNNLVDPIYLDIQFPPNSHVEQELPSGNNTLIYVIEGELKVGDNPETLSQKRLAILSSGTTLRLDSKDTSSRCLLISAMPIKEPVARGGPFVMNTELEVQQAFDDYRKRRFG